MSALLYKEMHLFASPITYFFLLFALMTLLPGYPILLGAFFVSFGIFQSFQIGRETNDVLYTVLLPIAKHDAVKARFLFICTIEILAFVIMALITALRMTLLADNPVYLGNALMNATPLFLGFACVVFAAFNWFFVRGFYKTAHNIGRPFIMFIIATFVIVFVGEALHFLPGLEWLNDPHGAEMGLQLAVFAVGIIIYAGVTFAAYRRSAYLFEHVDL